MRVLHVGHGYSPFHHGGLLAYVEDLMAAQAAAGHEVSYFCSGRNYPWPRPLLRRRAHGPVRLYEVVNSPVQIGPLERGTRHPRRDLDDAGLVRLFRTALEELRPDVVHVQELGALPSRLLDVAREAGFPVLMTLHDYFPLCPTIKLFDADGRICLRTEPAPQCARCCRDAPGPLDPMVGTLGFHRRAVERRVPAVARLPKPRELMRRRRGGEVGAERAVPATATPSPSAVDGDVGGYALRRSVNVERLGRVDRLLAVSPRVAEIYEGLGVDAGRLGVLPITLSRLASLTPGRRNAGRPVRFVTLAGCSTPAKGVHVIAGALEELAAAGLTDADLTLTVAGQIDPAVADRITASPLVRAIGSYPIGRLDSLLDAFDVGIVPSVWEETHGFTGVEMLAKGLPVIGNAVGGIVEYVRDGETGWLNRDRDAAGLARIMAAVAREPGRVAELSARVVELRGELVLTMPAHVEALDAEYRALAPQTSSTSAVSG